MYRRTTNDQLWWKVDGNAVPYALRVIVSPASKEPPGEIKDLQSKLKDVEKRINSMVDAIMDGVYSPSIKAKLSEVELEKEF